MSTTSEYLTKLQTDKATLVDNLVTKGVNATNDETFTSLVPKVLDIQSGSTAKITDCGYLFYQNRRLGSVYEILDLCKDVTSCQNMFSSCDELESLDMSGFDTSKVTNMGAMFFNCVHLVLSGIENWNTSQVTTMMSLFGGVVNIENFPVDWNVSNVTNMESTFNNYKGANIDISKWDTSNVTTTNSMFSQTTLSRIDLSNFDGDKITNSGGMFRFCYSLNTVIINNETLFKMTNTNMFQNTPIASGTGYVYVPDNMVETYKTATNWSTYADQIKPISELPTEEA